MEVDYVAEILDRMNIDNQVFVYGLGGCGKSVTLSKLVEILDDSITILAPTNAAKKVIKKMIKDSDNIQFGTLHQYLGLAGVDKEDIPLGMQPGETKFEKVKDGMCATKYVLIDEIGMVDGSMVYDVIAKSSDENIESKFIYFGDKMQLLPVNGEQFDLLDIIPSVHLEKQWRQKLSNTSLSNSIKTFTDAISDGSNVVGKLLECDNTLEEVESLIDLYCDGSVDVIGCWTNATVVAYNEAIQEKLNGTTDVQAGDTLLLYEPIVTWVKDTNGKYGAKVLANNGDFVQVSRVYKRNGLNMYDLIIDDKVEEYGFYLSNPLDKNYAWKLYEKLNPFRSNNKSWGFFKNNCIDARLPYSRTIHKLQGSTVKSIGLNVNDIDRAMFDKDLYNRLMYVGLSRATDKVYYVR
jgi:hypothetical protein